MSGNTVQRNTEQINNALNAIQHRRTTTGNELNTNTNQRQILQNPLVEIILFMLQMMVKNIQRLKEL